MRDVNDPLTYGELNTLMRGLLPALANRLDERAEGLDARVSTQPNDVAWMIVNAEVQVLREVAKVIRETMKAEIAGP